MIVNPNTTSSMTDDAVVAARRVASQDTCVVGGTPARGAESIESNVDEVWGALGVVEQVQAGQRAGVDGYVIACFGDTGVAAARELATGPVVGMTEAALLTAAIVAPRFCVVTLPRRTRQQSQRVVRELGLEHRCTVRAIDVAVAEIAGGAGRYLPALTEEARRGMEEDGAETVILGCAGLSDLVAPLSVALDIPVVDGIAAAVTMVEGLLAQGLSTSRRSTYAPPARLAAVAP